METTQLATDPRMIVAAEGAYEPQRTNNFILEIDRRLGVGSDQSSSRIRYWADPEVIRLSVRTFPALGISVAEGTIPYINEVRKFAQGPITYDGGDMTLLDYVDKDTRRHLYYWYAMVVDWRNGLIGYASRYKKQVVLRMFGPDGSDQRCYVIKGCWPRAVRTPEFNFNEPGPAMLTASLAWDRIEPTGMSVIDPIIG